MGKRYTLAEARRLLRLFAGNDEETWRANLHEVGCSDADGWSCGAEYADRLSRDYANPCKCGGVEAERDIEEFLNAT